MNLINVIHNNLYIIKVQLPKCIIFPFFRYAKFPFPDYSMMTLRLLSDEQKLLFLRYKLYLQSERVSHSLLRKEKIMEKFEELIQSPEPVLVDFFAEWCGPCKAMKPILSEVKEKIGDKARIAKIDVDQHKELSDRFKIKAVPTFILFKNGEAVWRHSGMIHAKELKEVIEQYI